MRVKITNTHLNKLESAAKNKKWTTFRINEKTQDKEIARELFVITRQTTKIRNTFANNMSTDINLSKAQISKIIRFS